MLKTISPYVGPDLLAALSRMGHGDEIVLADAHFPGHSHNERTLRADGVAVTQLLGGVLPLFPLDAAVPAPAVMMQVPAGATADPDIEAGYLALIAKHEPRVKAVERMERMAFYERARKAYAVVVSGDTRRFANLILRKGVVGL